MRCGPRKIPDCGFVWTDPAEPHWVHECVSPAGHDGDHLCAEGIEIAALKALHPNVDFTALDAAVTGVAGDVPAPVVPVTPPVTPAV